MINLNCPKNFTKKWVFALLWGLLVFISLPLAGCADGGVEETGDKVVFLAYHTGSIPILTESTRLYTVDLNDNSVAAIETPTSMKYYVEEAAWSPDGRWIAFTKIEDDPDTGQPMSRIYITDRAGKQTFLVASDGDSLSWSPDSDKIVYNLFQDGRDLLMIQDVGCILNSESCSIDPIFLTEGARARWAPNSDKIIYEREVDDFIYRVYIIDTNHLASPAALTPENMNCSFPNWSPNGEKIIVSCEVGVYDYTFHLMNSDGSGFTNLGIGDGISVWSPDGRKLVFASVSGSGLGKTIGWEFCTTDALFAYDLETRAVTRLTWRDNECIWWYTWLPSVR